MTKIVLKINKTRVAIVFLGLVFLWTILIGQQVEQHKLRGVFTDIKHTGH